MMTCQVLLQLCHMVLGLQDQPGKSLGFGKICFQYISHHQAAHAGHNGPIHFSHLKGRKAAAQTKFYVSPFLLSLQMGPGPFQRPFVNI